MCGKKRKGKTKNTKRRKVEKEKMKANEGEKVVEVEKEEINIKRRTNEGKIEEKVDTKINKRQ